MRTSPPMEDSDYHVMVDVFELGLEAARAKALALDAMWNEMFQRTRGADRTANPLKAGVLDGVQLTVDDVRTLSIRANDRVRAAERIFKLIDYRVIS